MAQLQASCCTSIKLHEVFIGFFDFNLIHSSPRLIWMEKKEGREKRLSQHRHDSEQQQLGLQAASQAGLQ